MPNLVAPLAALVWCLGLLGIGTAVWLVIDASARRAERPALEERLAQLQQRVKDIAAPAASPSRAELSATKQRVAAINALGGARGWPAEAMLAKLERLLPERAYLVSVHHQLRDGEVRLIAEATDAEVLTTFLINLEKEPHFTQVLLAKQSQHGSAAGRTVQFDIRVRERP